MEQFQEIKWRPTKKQKLAWDCLQDKTTTEIAFGGAAGGGKSYLGSVWIAVSCLRYPGSRWFMARAVIKHLRASTLLTFFDILNKWGLSSEEDYHYNGIEGTIRFSNGSEVYILDLENNPSDPLFDRLGSREFTGGFIDECSEISTTAYEIVMSRIRYKLVEFDLAPKLLMCSNQI